MDPTLLPAVQDLEAATNDAEAAQNARIEARLLDLHTCLPGAIISYDSTKKTAKCKPGIKRIFRGEKGAVDLPDLVDCPVYFPSGGGFTLSFPVAAGDECLLVFSERAIDMWWQNGIKLTKDGAQLPSEYRTHDLSDAFAFVGISSQAHLPSSLATDAVELRDSAGTTKVRIDKSGNVAINAAGSVTVGATGTTAINGQQVLLNAPPGAAPKVNGVLMGSCPCLVTGAPHATAGAGTSQTVMVGE